MSVVSEDYLYIHDGLKITCIFCLSSVSKGSHTDFCVTRKSISWKDYSNVPFLQHICPKYLSNKDERDDPSVTTNSVFPLRLMLLFKGWVCTVTGRCNSKNKATLPSFVIRLRNFPHPYPQKGDHFGAFNLSVHSCSRSGYLRNRLRKGDQQAEYYWGVFSGLVPVRGVEEGDLGRGRHWTVAVTTKV